jgi:hypothetical protein
LLVFDLHFIRGDHEAEPLSVFKGREAKINKAIFWILAHESPLTIYEICKKVRTQKSLRYTRYSVVNRRVRSLEELSYIEKAGPKKTRAGFEAQLYQITFRALFSQNG